MEDHTIVCSSLLYKTHCFRKGIKYKFPVIDICNKLQKFKRILAFTFKRPRCIYLYLSYIPLCILKCKIKGSFCFNLIKYRIRQFRCPGKVIIDIFCIHMGYLRLPMFFFILNRLNLIYLPINVNLHLVIYISAFLIRKINIKLHITFCIYFTNDDNVKGSGKYGCRNTSFIDYHHFVCIHNAPPIAICFLHLL